MSNYRLLLFFIFALGLSACSAGRPLPQLDEPLTGTYGLVSLAGQPVSGAWVYAYQRPQGNFRGPADYAARVDADGRYILDLLPGSWYLVSRSRSQGGIDGPPKPGDAWSIYPENPILLADGEKLHVDFQLAGVNQTMLLRGGSLASGDTGFRGRLVDGQGRVVLGAIALAYADTEFRRVPDHTSAAVSATGEFILYVPQPGRYCLAGRQRTRGQPIQGELYGTLGAGDAACRAAVSGKIIAVGDIRLTPYLR